jgi:hypothetical protein
MKLRRWRSTLCPAGPARNTGAEAYGRGAGHDTRDSPGRMLPGTSAVGA